MTSLKNITYFIASKDFEVPDCNHKKILTGTLMRCTQTSTKKKLLNLETLEVTKHYFELKKDADTIQQVEPDYVDYLLGISNLKKRFAFYDPHKLKRALKAKVGELVKVPVKTESGEECLADACIRFKGNAGENGGILFGVELLTNRGLGTTDGEFWQTKYFVCDTNCGMFVPYDKLEFDGQCDDTVKAVGDKFRVGMRVNISDIQVDGKEYNVSGVLKYILPSQTTPNRSIAGVELEEHVRGLNYSGTYKSCKYFEPVRNVAILPLEYVVPSKLITDDKSKKGLFDHVKTFFDNKMTEHSYSLSNSQKEKKKTEARDEIKEINPITWIDDGLLRKISKGLGKNWLYMGEVLQLSKKKLDKISQNSTDCTFEEKALIMLMTWQSGTADMIDKLGFIAHSCKFIGKEQLCYNILQGVDDEIVELVAEEADVIWEVLAKMLNIPDDVIKILCKKHKTNDVAICSEILKIWRTNQPDSSDKISFLASVLNQLGLHQVATFLIKGLDDSLLEQLSVGLVNSWKDVVTELGMTRDDIIDIERESSDKSKQAYQAFTNWKKQQPSEADKFGKLANALRKSGHNDMANHLLGGIEDGAIHKIVVALGRYKIDKQSLCQVLNFTIAQLKYFDRKFHVNFAVMKQMLFVWRAQQDRTQDKKQILINLLTKWGFYEIAKNVFSDTNQIHDVSDEMEVDIDDYVSNSVSDEIITIISESLLKCDVIALKTYLGVEQSLSTPDDFKSEALKLLMQAREFYPKNFKNFLIEGLESISRKDLAQLLTEEKIFHEIKASKSQPTRDNKERPGRQHTVLQHQFSIGTMVEVDVGKKVLYGVIKWIGYVAEIEDEIAGIELEEECEAATDGKFGNKRYFQTLPRHGFFIHSSKCRPDCRFSSPLEPSGSLQKPVVEFDSPSVTEITLPPMLSKFHPYDAMGIQGDQNSCYLDSTIFSMFAFVDVFDGLLHRPSNKDDVKGYNEVQKVLKEDIVYPLRRNGFVKFENIRQLRKLLDELGSTIGMRDQEKDPEEFLTTLLQEILKSDPLFKIRVYGSETPQEMNFYQMFMERDNTLTGTPNVQTLLEQSFLNTDIKLTEIPSCFVVQMPRFGKAYKLYNRILPTLELDITHMLEKFPRPCVVCGRLSILECRDCSSAKLGGEQITAYCQNCYERAHKNPDKKNHAKARQLEIPECFPQNLTEEEERKELHSEIMELFAVVCIETSHYVAFVKSGEEKNSKWLFFDSMADRIGDQDGFNIPKIKELPKFQSWIKNPEEYEHRSDRELEEPLRRLLCDAYMCFYRSTTVCA